MSSNLFTGPFPDISNMPQLQICDLSLNRFGGTIPEKMSVLTKLEILYFHGNELTGVIPNELGKLKNLREISLNHNKFLEFVYEF